MAASLDPTFPDNLRRGKTSPKRLPPTIGRLLVEAIEAWPDPNKSGSDDISAGVESFFYDAVKHVGNILHAASNQPKEKPWAAPTTGQLTELRKMLNAHIAPLIVGSIARFFPFGEFEATNAEGLLPAGSTSGGASGVASTSAAADDKAGSGGEDPIKAIEPENKEDEDEGTKVQGRRFGEKELDAAIKALSGPTRKEKKVALEDDVKTAVYTKMGIACATAVTEFLIDSGHTREDAEQAAFTHVASLAGSMWAADLLKNDRFVNLVSFRSLCNLSLCHLSDDPSRTVQIGSGMRTNPRKTTSDKYKVSALLSKTF